MEAQFRSHCSETFAAVAPSPSLCNHSHVFVCRGVVSMLAAASLASQQRGDLLTDLWDSAGRHDIVVPSSFGARPGPPQLRLNICSVLKPNEKTTNTVKQPWGLIHPEFNQPLTAVNTCTEGILRRSRMFSSVSGKRFKTMQLCSVWGLIPWTQLCIFPSLDAEPKYLVAVQPIPVNDVKKHCTGTAEPLPVWVNAAVYGDRKSDCVSPVWSGKVNLEKPLHLVIDSVSPTTVLLSWGNYLKTPYEGNILNECLEDGWDYSAGTSWRARCVSV